jgi:hypothetical protein
MRFDALMAVTVKIIPFVGCDAFTRLNRQYHILKMDIFRTLLPQHTNIDLKNIKAE